MKKLMLAVVASLLAVGCGGDDDNGTPDSGGGGPDGGGGQVTELAATLTTTAEVPVCDAAGATAAGTATISISADDSTITVNVQYTGLSGDATAGHIHAAAAGAAGPAIFPFDQLASPINATFTAADYPSPPPEGAPADFAAAVALMKAGGTYVNIHTAACAPGEIRGQIE